MAFSWNVGKRMFRARSLERDAATDFQRIQALSDAISSTLSAVELERTGLRARLEIIRINASVAAGNGSDDYLERDAHDAKTLQDLEKQMGAAEKRLRDLTGQIDRLDSLKKSFSTLFA